MSPNRSRRKSRTWIVSELYWPEETGVGHYVTGTAEELATHRDIGVICGQPTYSMRGTKAPRIENRHNVLIRRVKSTTYAKDSTAGRIANTITLTASLSWSVLRSVRHGDSVVVVTSPPTLPYTVAALCRLRRVPYTVFVYDLFPYQLLAAGMLSQRSVVARLAPALNRWLYRGARSVAVIGRDLEERIGEIVEGSGATVGVVPVWADLDTIHVRPRASSRLLHDLGLADKFVIQFAGNIGPLQDVPTVLDAMEIVSAHGEIHLLVVGDGRKRRWLDDEVERRKLTNVTVIDPVLRKDADEIHQACDVAIVSLTVGMWGVAVPSRTYNFLAAGKPIIAAVDPRSEVGRLVAENRIGWVTGSGDARALAEAFQGAASNRERTATMGIEARRVVEEEYSRSHVVARMAAILDGEGPAV